jgi:hypothetical protein
VPRCASSSGGTHQGRFHTHLPNIHHRVVITLLFFKVLKVSGGSGEAVKQAKRFEVFTFIIKPTNHSVDLRFAFAWVAWYESIIRGGEGARGTRCATMPSGRTVPGMRGRCGRVNHRSGRSPPSAPLRAGWGTTGSATHTGCRGSGSELRFSFGGVAWYELIIGHQGGGGVPDVPPCELDQGRQQRVR